MEDASGTRRVESISTVVREDFILDESRTWIDPRARVGRDSVIYPDVIIEGTADYAEGHLELV